MSVDWNNQKPTGGPSWVHEEAAVPQFAPVVYANQPPTSEQVQQFQPAPQQDQEEYDDEYYDQMVLNDARLRLVQGSLYEKIMSHNIFEGYDADPIAIRNVEREIKRFARERMEIMLGMRQEKQVQQVQAISQFSDLEVTILKALVSKGTKGQSDSPEINKITTSTSKKLNTIGSGAPAPSTSMPKLTPQPVAAPQPQAQAPRPPAQAPKPPVKQQSALTIEPDPEVDMTTTRPKQLEEMNDEERANYIQKNLNRYKQTTPNSGKLAMPTAGQEASGWASAIMSASRAAEHAAISRLVDSKA